MRTKTLTAIVIFASNLFCWFFLSAQLCNFHGRPDPLLLFPCEAPLKPGVGLLWSLSIILFLPLLTNSNLGAKVGYTLRKLQVYRWRDKQAFRLTLADGLSSPVDLACVSLDCGREPEYLKRTRAGTEHANRTESNPTTFWLSVLREIQVIIIWLAHQVWLKEEVCCSVNSAQSPLVVLSGLQQPLSSHDAMMSHKLTWTVHV